MLEKIGAVQDVALKAAREVDASTSEATKVEWKLFMYALQADTDIIFKALDHLKFLQQ